MRIQLRATEMQQGVVKFDGVALHVIIGGLKIVVACREGLCYLNFIEYSNVLG